MRRQNLFQQLRCQILIPPPPQIILIFQRFKNFGKRRIRLLLVYFLETIYFLDYFEHNSLISFCSKVFGNFETGRWKIWQAK